MEYTTSISTDKGRASIEEALSFVSASVKVIGSQETEDGFTLIVEGPEEFVTRFEQLLNPTILLQDGEAYFSLAAMSYLARKSQAQSGHFIQLGGSQYLYHVKGFCFFLWKSGDYGGWCHYEVNLTRYPAGPFRTRLDALRDIHGVEEGS
jgi:hypothetical protein